MSDLDDEELIATRRLNGLDDGLYKESDKNVASDKDYTLAYLKGYADAEEKYKNRIKELEEDLYSANKTVEEYTNSIPVQKVKETVKEVIELIESEQFKIIMGDMTKVGRIKYLLKELLEEK